MEGAVERSHGACFAPVGAIPEPQEEVGIAIRFPGNVDHPRPIRRDHGLADLLLPAEAAVDRFRLVPEDEAEFHIPPDLLKGHLVSILVPPLGLEIDEGPHQKADHESHRTPQVDSEAQPAADTENDAVILPLPGDC